MQKIPTMFVRDWNGDRSRVLDQRNPECLWLFEDPTYTYATRKFDGTCCMIERGMLFKRRELRKGDAIPADFRLVSQDNETGKTIGWMPVTDASDDKYHREAFERLGADALDGTYELVGPKIQGNPENYSAHTLVRHGAVSLEEVPIEFNALRDYLATRDIEGVVFYYQDGRMAKIKKRDFGLKRKP